MTATDRDPPLGDIVSSVADRLEAGGLFLGHGTDNWWDEAVHLVLPVLGLGPDAPAANLDLPVDAALIDTIEARVAERLEGMPVAYINGHAWYGRRRYRVTRETLIPRSPLWELTDTRFEGLETLAPEGRALDLCCGSGCIGIDFAHAFPGWKVTLADLSAPALATAARNVHEHGVADRVHLVRSDLLAGVHGRFDLILCNPPYVSAAEWEGLPAEYHAEPVGALVPPGGEAMLLVGRLLASAAASMTDTGVLYLEVGESAGEFAAHWPDLALTPIEFAWGGGGVFRVDAARLARHAQPAAGQRL